MQPNWPMESTSTKMRRAPQSDGYVAETIRQQGLEYSDVSGMLMEKSVGLSAPVSSIYDPEVPGSYFAYLRKLVIERRRVWREIAVQENIVGEMARERKCGKPGSTPDIKNKRLPTYCRIRRLWQNLRVCNCAGCRKTLLGESEEAYRASVAHLRFADNIPPPVEARTDWGPWCGQCVKEGRVR